MSILLPCFSINAGNNSNTVFVCNYTDIRMSKATEEEMPVDEYPGDTSG